MRFMKYHEIDITIITKPGYNLTNICKRWHIGIKKQPIIHTKSGVQQLVTFKQLGRG